MRRNSSKKGKITAAFMVMLFVATFMISFLPEVAVAQEVAMSIEPGTGNVGNTISVNGTIETPNGTYTIFFDGTLVKSGNATNNEVDDTFTVPNRPAGNYDVILHDVGANKNSTAVVFTIETAYHIKAVVPTSPKQLQELNSTTIWVNVTGGEMGATYHPNITVVDPANNNYYNSSLLLSVNSEGDAGISTIYPTYFLPATAHTNLTGWYDLYFNKTDSESLAHNRIFIGLTNATEYYRFQVVEIKAANYTLAGERARVNIIRGINVNYGEIIFSKNVSATGGGIINTNWTVPGDASMGFYNVTVTSLNGTVKPVLDSQLFMIVKIPCQIQTKKLNGEILADVWVDVFNETTDLIDSKLTDEEGLVSVSVEGGNYTFGASLAINYLEYAEVGILVNQSIKESVNITLWCWVAHLNIKTSPLLPFINITLTYQNVTASFETNITGICKIPRNLPTNISYTIVARRYGYPFYNETLEKLPGAAMNVSWVNLTIPVPTYTLFVQALDSKESPVQNVKVAVYEWSSGVAKPVQSETTNDQGNATFHILFGKYKIWVYNPDQTIVLNETVVNLTEDQMLFVVRCKIFNVDLSVVVNDYFGNPISNALVKVERVLDAYTQKTGSNGKASFENITGGEIRVSVSVNGKLCETRTIYLDETKVVEFKLGKYVMVAGYPLETTQFVACISLGTLIALFVLALIYRRFRTRKVSEEKEKTL